MASSKAVKYAPNVDFTMEGVDLTKNNVVGNFSYPQIYPAYKNVMKFLRNCFLAKAFTHTPSVIYHDYLREFWCTAVATSPKDTKESIITFTVMNGSRTLSFDYSAFIKATGLDFAEAFSPNPTDQDIKNELIFLAPHDPRRPQMSVGGLLEKAPIVKTWFHPIWRILMTFVIQVLGGNKSSTEQLNSSQKLMLFSLLEGTKIDIGGIIFRDLVAKLSGKHRQRHMSYPRFVSCVL